jgi:hypothetical protein
LTKAHTNTSSIENQWQQNEPIRPTVNNIQAPSYKIAKYLNKSLNNLGLPCTANKPPTFQKK